MITKGAFDQAYVSSLPFVAPEEALQLAMSSHDLKLKDIDGAIAKCIADGGRKGRPAIVAAEKIKNSAADKDGNVKPGKAPGAPAGRGLGRDEARGRQGPRQLGGVRCGCSTVARHSVDSCHGMYCTLVDARPPRAFHSHRLLSHLLRFVSVSDIESEDGRLRAVMLAIWAATAWAASGPPPSLPLLPPSLPPNSPFFVSLRPNSQREGRPTPPWKEISSFPLAAAAVTAAREQVPPLPLAAAAVAAAAVAAAAVAAAAVAAAAVAAVHPPAAPAAAAVAL